MVVPPADDLARVVNSLGICERSGKGTHDQIVEIDDAGSGRLQNCRLAPPVLAAWPTICPASLIAYGVKSRGVMPSPGV